MTRNAEPLFPASPLHGRWRRSPMQSASGCRPTAAVTMARGHRPLARTCWIDAEPDSYSRAAMISVRSVMFGHGECARQRAGACSVYTDSTVLLGQPPDRRCRCHRSPKCRQSESQPWTLLQDSRALNLEDRPRCRDARSRRRRLRAARSSGPEAPIGIRSNVASRELAVRACLRRHDGRFVIAV